jgi:hypothetical protein
MRSMYDLLLKTLRIHRDDTVHLPAWAVKALYAPMDAVRRKVRRPQRQSAPTARRASFF